MTFFVCECLLGKYVYLLYKRDGLSMAATAAAVENKQLRTGKWCTFVHLHSGDFICICYSSLI